MTQKVPAKHEQEFIFERAHGVEYSDLYFCQTCGATFETFAPGTVDDGVPQRGVAKS